MCDKEGVSVYHEICPCFTQRSVHWKCICRFTYIEKCVYRSSGNSVLCNRNVCIPLLLCVWHWRLWCQSSLVSSSSSNRLRMYLYSQSTVWLFSSKGVCVTFEMCVFKEGNVFVCSCTFCFYEWGKHLLECE